MNLTDILTPDVQTLIVNAVISVVGILITVALKMGLNLIKAKTTAEQFAFLQEAATVAVQAAEQLHLTGVINDKKAAAIDVLVRELATKGIKVDATAIDTAIEAAVMNAFNTDRTAAPADGSVDAAIVPPYFTFTGVDGSANQS